MTVDVILGSATVEQVYVGQFCIDSKDNGHRITTRRAKNPDLKRKVGKAGQ